MSKQLKSLKADKELMWQKLSTVPEPFKNTYTWWSDKVRRGTPTGELTVVAAKSNCGKTYYDI